MRRRGLIAAVAGVLLGTLLAVTAVRWWLHRPRREPAAAATPHVEAGAPVPHVAVTLFDPAPDTDALAPVQREIPKVTDRSEHARLVVEAALERAALPAIGLWPTGTVLRTCFLAPDGEVIVDVTGLPPGGLGGGTTAERLAIQALVSAVRANIPGVTSVRLLLDGHPADALATHVDLRGPLAADRESVRRAERAAAPPAP